MPTRALIVDDQPHLASMLSDMLTEAGFLTSVAGDGHAALAAIQAEAPDIVLLDAQMPEMDGYELTTMLKSDPATATIPIIMVSANESRASRVVGLESGAEDYLAKPVDPVELLAKIRNLLLLRDRAARAGQ